MPSLKPYPAYADTDLPWLPKIPKHWEAKPLFAVMKERQRKNIGNKETNVLSLSYGHIIRRDVESNFGLLPESFETYQIVHPGNIVLRLTDLQNDKRSLRTGQVEEKGIITSAYTCLEVGKQMDDKFAHYVLHGYDLLKVFYQLGAGVRQTMNFDDLKRLLVLVPPLPEQRTIAAYLDRQTAKIDALIAKKQRLLDLLSEQRAALISQAVTKGLNPAVKMKDSGVAWLGQVPSHWEVLHLRRVVNKFVDYRGHTPPKVDEGIPLITARNIKKGKIDWELSQEYIPEELYNEWMVRGFPELGDVLVTMEAPLGETAQITETHIALAQRIILLKADKAKIQNDYLKYFLASSAGQGELWSRATGSTAIGIKASHLKEVIVIVPPVEEQNEIVKVIKQEEDKVFALIPKVEQAIDHLQEYRTALISSVVTGKVQVK